MNATKQYTITTEWIDQQILNGETQEEILQQFKKKFFPELKKSKNKLTSLEEIIQVLPSKGFPAENIKEEQEGRYNLRLPNDRIRLTYNKQKKTYNLQFTYLNTDISACNAQKIADMIVRISTDGQAWKDGNLAIKQCWQAREKIHKQFLESDNFVNTPYNKLFYYYKDSQDFAGIHALKKHIVEKFKSTLTQVFKAKKAETGQPWEGSIETFEQEHYVSTVETYTSNGTKAEEIITAKYQHIIVEIENNTYETVSDENFWQLYGYCSQDYAINIFNYSIREVVKMIMYSFECSLKKREPLPVLPYLANVPQEKTLDTVCSKCHAFMQEKTLAQFKTQAGKETISQLTQEFYEAVKQEIQSMFQYLEKDYPDWLPFSLQVLPTNYTTYSNEEQTVSINVLSPFCRTSNHIRESILQKIPFPTSLPYFGRDYWQRQEDIMYTCGIINTKGLMTPLMFKHSPTWKGFLASCEQAQAEELDNKLKYISKYLSKSKIVESLPPIDVTQE